MAYLRDRRAFGNIGTRKFRGARFGDALSPRGSWTPADIDTAAWFDAADTGTITESAGSVSIWGDKSGNAVNVIQSTISNQPSIGNRLINGLNSIEFDGVNSFLDIDNSSIGNVINGTDKDFIVFAVCKSDLINKTSYICNINVDNSTADSSVRIGLNATGKFWSVYRDSNSLTDIVPLLGSQTTNVSLISCGNDGSNLNNILNGGSISNSNPNPLGSFSGADRLTLGQGFSNSERWDGLLGELVIINNYTSLEIRQKMEGYLAWKWGLEASLPADHPFKTSPPMV